jgi:gas vesicle protein
MEFIVGLSIGAAAGIMAGVLFRNGSPVKADANKHVDTLNTQAQKNLQKLQQNRNQIAQVGQKAQTAQQDLNSKITELVNQE